MPAWNVGALVLIAAFIGGTLVVLGMGILSAVAEGSEDLHTRLHEIGFGTGIVARAAQGIADASHRTQPVAQIILDYLFSGFNLVVAAFLLWLRPRDRTSRLLAAGMIGTAAIFNLQAESVYLAIPKTVVETTLYSGHRFVTGIAYTAALLLFPDSRLIPRWRPAAQAALYVPAVATVAYLAFRSPAGQQSAGTVTLIVFFGLFIPLAAVFSQAYRYRRSPTAEERQQSRLLFWALVPAAVMGLIVLTQGIRDALAAPGLEGRGLQELPVLVFRIFQPLFSLIPLALFLGLIRYRLWNIDKVISRAIAYSAMVVLVGVVYIGVVVGAGSLMEAQNNPILSAAATAVVALGFQPVRERLQSLANRLVYGKRATPYEILSEFSERMTTADTTDEILECMVGLLASGADAASAQVWLRVGEQVRPAAFWPEAAEPPAPRKASDELTPATLGVDLVVPVRHRGELLGVFAVAKRESESLSLPEEKLVSDLAAQAGVVLRNVRLTAELLERLEDLRASRQRLVTAQDEERRKLERNLHDGAQQQLVALKVKMGLAERLAGEELPQLKELLERLRGETDEAIETLRDLARGIYPPLLAAEGLHKALEAQARKTPFPVEVTSSGLSRHGQDVEAAVYFCCLEALQNVAKYAGAATARIVIGVAEGVLTFAVSDDGRGFRMEDITMGAGLQNMTDRIEALGGSLKIESEPGRGTTVRGTIPVPDPAPQPEVPVPA